MQGGQGLSKKTLTKISNVLFQPKPVSRSRVSRENRVGGKKLQQGEWTVEHRRT